MCCPDIIYRGDTLKNKVLYEFKYFLSFFALTLLFVLLSAALTAFSQNLYNIREGSTNVLNVLSEDTVIIIDAGHGGEDGGAVSDNGVVEKHLNLDIALKLNDMFSLTGYKSVLVRSDDRLMYEAGQEKHKKASDITNRINFAKAFPNSVFISIHQNKFPIKKYSGLQVYYSKNDERSKAFGETIQYNAKALLQNSNNRQAKKADKNIRLLDSLDMPSVLVECGFLSNDEEARLLSTEEYRNKIVHLIFYSVIDYLDKNKDGT